MSQKELKEKIIDLMFKNFGNCPKKLPNQILELLSQEKQKWVKEILTKILTPVEIKKMGVPSLAKALTKLNQRLKK